jgi:hypothetical protein
MVDELVLECLGCDFIVLCCSSLFVVSVGVVSVSRL